MTTETQYRKFHEAAASAPPSRKHTARRVSVRCPAWRSNTATRIVDYRPLHDPVTEYKERYSMSAHTDGRLGLNGDLVADPATGDGWRIMRGPDGRITRIPEPAFLSLCNKAGIDPANAGRAA